MRGLNIRRWLLLVFCSSAPACAQPQEQWPDVGLNRTCLESLATQAFANPRTNDFAANYAGPLGLTPSSDPDAPPYRTKQVEFRFAETMHYFAVDGPDWSRALLVRLVPTQPQPRLRLFVVDRDGALLAAGIIENRRMTVLNVHDAAVRREFLTEQVLWRAAGHDDACGES